MPSRSTTYLCAVNPGFEHQSLRVHQQMALSAFDLLGAIVAAPFSTDPGRLHRLTI
jgi:hypothetical protein